MPPPLTPVILLGWAAQSPTFWLTAALAIASLVAASRRRRALALPLLLASWQSAALTGVASLAEAVASLADGHLIWLQLAFFGALFPALLPAAATMPVLLLARRWPPYYLPGPILSVGASVTASLVAIVGTPLALTTRYGAWPTWTDFLSLFS